MNTKVAFLVPIHPPHFHFARDLLVSLHNHGLDKETEVWFVFTDEVDKASFGDYPYTIVLPENLRIFDNNGIINIKKFYGLRQIQDKYPYVIVLDAESQFIRNVNVFALCEEYFSSKILLGNEVLPEGTERTEGIKNSCKRFFAGHKDFEKLNNPLYLWFNQPCIYKTDTLNDFWDKINYDKNIAKLQWADFDYYMYMFYLILYHGFNIEDIDIRSNYGICEATEDLLFFKSDKYETLPIFMASQPVLHKFDNPKCFIAIHLDRNKDWLLRVMTQKIDYLMQEIRELKNQKKREQNSIFYKLLVPSLSSTQKKTSAVDIKSDKKVIADEDISFVIQGKVNKQTTPKAIASIRQFFPGAEIVLSTYIGTETSGLNYDKIALVEDPGFFYYDDQERSKENNLNRQIQTTLAGLNAATRQYAFKLRTDFIITGRGFLDYFYRFPESDSNYKVFGRKVLSCVFFARNPRKENPLSFHPSDIAFFGLRADLLKLFDIPFMTKEDSLFYKVNKKRCCKYVPEQHIWVNCLLKNGKKIKFEHQRDTSEKIVADTEKYTVSNFIYLDFRQFNLLAPKQLRMFANNDFHDVITHIEWQRLYKKYLDESLVVPDEDSIRDFVEQKTFIFKWYNFLAKVVTMFFVGKSLRNFRRGTRKKILQKLTRNICLPK